MLTKGFRGRPGRDLLPCGQGGEHGARSDVGGLMSDAEWGFFEPFLGAVRAPQGRRGGDHRRVLDGVFWIARTGSAWRDLPEEFGKWSSVYRQFRRWTLAGLWEAVLEALNEGAASVSKGSPDRLQMIDSTIVRAHQHAAGAPKRGGEGSANAFRPVGDRFDASGRWADESIVPDWFSPSLSPPRRALVRRNSYEADLDGTKIQPRNAQPPQLFRAARDREGILHPPLDGMRQGSARPRCRPFSRWPHDQDPPPRGRLGPSDARPVSRPARSPTIAASTS